MNEYVTSGLSHLRHHACSQARPGSSMLDVAVHLDLSSMHRHAQHEHHHVHSCGSSANCLPLTCSRKVSLESRKGTWRLAPRCSSMRDMMTWPKVLRDLLMDEASFNRSPVAPEAFWRSLPVAVQRIRAHNTEMHFRMCMSSAAHAAIAVHAGVLV